MAEAHGTPAEHGAHAIEAPVGPPASDVNGERLVITVVAVVIAATIAFLVVTWLINIWTLLNPAFLIPGNMANLNVEVTEQDIRDRQEFVRNEFRDLNSYDVLDPETGRVAIPINRAMQLYLERGVPVMDDGPNPIRTAPGSVDARSGFTLEAAQQLAGPAEVTGPTPSQQGQGGQSGSGGG